MLWCGGEAGRTGQTAFRRRHRAGVAGDSQAVQPGCLPRLPPRLHHGGKGQDRTTTPRLRRGEGDGSVRATGDPLHPQSRRGLRHAGQEPESGQSWAGRFAAPRAGGGRAGPVPEGRRPTVRRPALSLQQIDSRTVSIWTVHGRLSGIPFACSAEQAKMLAAHRRGESDLVWRGGCFYLYATCDVPQAPSMFRTGSRVDLGIVNIATASDGTVHSGKHVNQIRHRNRRLRSKLQAKGTKSAKRLLRHLSGREARFAADTNHRISKSIVTEAQRTTHGIALEDLGGIRARVRLRKPQRVTLHTWSFAQLGAFIAYKAERAGAPVVFVDPRHTSQECSACGHIDKKNRPDQATFKCTSCGFAEHADVNAARNIAARGAAGWASESRCRRRGLTHHIQWRPRAASSAPFRAEKLTPSHHRRTRRDLHRGDRRDDRQAADPGLVRRAVLLRHVVGDGQLPDDLRVLTGRALPFSSFWHRINKRSRTPTNAIWLYAAARSSSRCPRSGTSPPTWPSRRSRSSASTSPT